MEEHYILYDGGIEGIRNGCQVSGKMCEIHRNVLGCDWRGAPVNRVPAPVPSDFKDEFQYTIPDLSFVPGKITSIPNVDEFCPRVKIEETVKEIGPLDIQHSNTINYDGSISKFWNDKNDTVWMK